MPADEIAQMIHYCRRESGLSQQELARLAGVGKTIIFDIEKGKKTIQFNNLLKILEVLNIKIKFESPFAQTKDNIS